MPNEVINRETAKSIQELVIELEYATEKAEGVAATLKEYKELEIDIKTTVEKLNGEMMSFKGVIADSLKEETREIIAHSKELNQLSQNVNSAILHIRQQAENVSIKVCRANMSFVAALLIIVFVAGIGIGIGIIGGKVS